MIYLCECGIGYTIPAGDFLIQKNIKCKCGSIASNFKVSPYRKELLLNCVVSIYEVVEPVYNTV